MYKNIALVGGFLLFALILLGGGCSNNVQTVDVMENKDNAIQSTSPSNDKMETKKDDTMTGQSEVKVFDVTGKNFAFSVQEIKVKAGDKVTINFTSTDGFHDWVVDEFNAKTQKVQIGGKTTVTFVASKSGTYEYYCSVGSHRKLGMVGKLIVE